MTDPPFDVCVVGSANLDLVARVERLPGPGETVTATEYAEHAGGKGLNQAVAAARSGARTALVAALGEDAASERLRAVLHDDRIADRTVTTTAAPTGRALIAVDVDAENSIVVVPGANHVLAASTPVPDAAVVLVQLEIRIDTVVAAARVAKQAGSLLVLNPAPAHPLPAELVGLCDVIVPNEHEVDLLGGAGALLDLGCDVVVITKGAAGCEIVTATARRAVPSFHVEPLDTTGAGDAFCGALASRLAAGDELGDAVRWATAAGALATTVEGAVRAQPTAPAIRQLLDAAG